MTFINANVLSNFVSLQCLSSLLNALLQNTMAEQNVPAQPPTRTDEQIVPRSQWLTIGKSNLLFNAQKIQKNPIFQISVDILSNTNFFQAFTASANVPAIYLQQFWKTIKALAITPVNPTHPFELPPSGDTIIADADIGRVYSRDPDIFLTQSKSTKPVRRNPKKESNSSPHSLDGFPRKSQVCPKGSQLK
ncbi:hypothetical protein Tco_1019705 [Tanacetum coccineum]|uniref:Uncharacterized protein n=1 Tax=Tanacetum coccineum TaxID=301880 RepID=A0ABQ5FXY2_9ASTR